MWRVNLHQHVELFRKLNLGAEVFVFGRCLLVVADLAHRDDAFLEKKTRQDLHNLFG